MPLQPMEPSDVHRPAGQYSHAVRVSGSLLFISGQVGLDGAGTIAGDGEIAAQCEQIFKNLEAILTQAGAGFHNLAKVNYYITDMAKAGVVREIRARYLQDHRPASTFVEVSELVDPRLLLEIEAVAVLD